VRRPQLGISDAEKKQLIDNYNSLKNNKFRVAANA
jgi:hypothetical protein